MNNKVTSQEMRPGLSRRHFLSQAVIAGAGLVAAPLLLSGQSAEAGVFDFTPSPADQKKVGDEAAKQILQQYREIRDSRSRHFQNVGGQLVSALPANDRVTWDYRFHLIDSNDVNAFALPGGNVFLFSGLYDRMDTEDALAAVTGHEMTHVRKQHWAKAYAQQQQRDLLLGLGLNLFHANQATQQLAGLADTAIGLKFSRTEEDQADAGGLDDMVTAGFNPEGMVHLFDTLKQVAGNGGTLGSDFLSTHPLTSTRIQHTERRIASIQQGRQFRPLQPLR